MAETLNTLIVVRAVGTGDDQTYTMARAGQVLDCVLIATNGGAGTVTLQNGATAITAALNPASTDTAVIRPAQGGTFVVAPKSLIAGDVLTFNVSAATLNYEAYAYIYPTPAVAE